MGLFKTTLTLGIGAIAGFYGIDYYKKYKAKKASEAKAQEDPKVVDLKPSSPDGLTAMQPAELFEKGKSEVEQMYKKHVDNNQAARMILFGQPSQNTTLDSWKRPTYTINKATAEQTGKILGKYGHFVAPTTKGSSEKQNILNHAIVIYGEKIVNPDEKTLIVKKLKEFYKINESVVKSAFTSTEEIMAYVMNELEKAIKLLESIPYKTASQVQQLEKLIKVKENKLYQKYWGNKKGVK